MVPAIHGPSARDFGDFLGSERGAAFFSGAWAGSRSSSCLSSSTPCSARSCSSGGCCCRACEPSSAGGLGRQGAVHPLSPARCMGHAKNLGGGRLSRGLSGAALPERVDGDHRALGSERLRDRRRPYPRPQVVRYCHFATAALTLDRQHAAWTARAAPPHRARGRRGDGCRSDRPVLNDLDAEAPDVEVEVRRLGPPSPACWPVQSPSACCARQA